MSAVNKSNQGAQKGMTHKDAVAFRPVDWTGVYPPAFPPAVVPKHVAIVMDGNGRGGPQGGRDESS
jgi:undecaprenyl diphosphate synthase